MLLNKAKNVVVVVISNSVMELRVIHILQCNNGTLTQIMFVQIKFSQEKTKDISVSSEVVGDLEWSWWSQQSHFAAFFIYITIIKVDLITN